MNFVIHNNLFLQTFIQTTQYKQINVDNTIQTHSLKVDKADKSIDEYPKYHKPKRLDRGMNYGNNTGGTGQKGGETHQI